MALDAPPEYAEDIPMELLGRERGKRMVWEATDAKRARMAEAAKS